MTPEEESALRQRAADAEARVARLTKDVAEIVQVAERHGWNGVENSKILWDFFDNELTDLRTETERLRQLLDQVNEERNALRAANAKAREALQRVPLVGLEMVNKLRPAPEKDTVLIYPWHWTAGDMRAMAEALAALGQEPGEWCSAPVQNPGHKCALKKGHAGPHNVWTAGEPDVKPQAPIETIGAIDGAIDGAIAPAPSEPTYQGHELGCNCPQCLPEVADAIARARGETWEAAIAVVKGGRFLHDQAPAAQFAREVVAAMERARGEKT